MNTAADRDRYIQRRLQQIRWWNRLGWLTVVAIGAAAATVYQTAPLLFDPAKVLQLAQSNQLPNAQLVQLAALGNLAFAGCVMLMLGLVLYAYIAVNSERRSIELLLQPIAPSAVPDSSSLSEPQDATE